MLKDGATGSLTHHCVEAGSDASFIAKTGYYFIYLATGTAILSNGNAAKAGDLLQIGNGADVTIHAGETCNLVIVEVSVDAEDAV